MEDIIDIIVTETTNLIQITSSGSDELIDVNIIDNREDIVLNVTPTVVEININSLVGNFGVNWGQITGSLSNQTDLNYVLSIKADLVGGLVPSFQLPSYVDDVVEVANYAALPLTGESGKIYVTIDTNFIYRWTGSVYVEIKDSSAVWGAITGTLSNQTDLQNALNAKEPTITAGTTLQYYRGDKTFQTLNTSIVPELTNLYFLDSRARAAISGGTGISYNSGTGVITNAVTSGLIATALGYTPADDALVVKLAGAQTITGTKTFNQAPLLDLGAGFKNSNGVYNYLQSLVTGWQVPVNGQNHNLIFSTATNYVYTFPNASGTIALTSDLHNAVTLGMTNGLSLSAQVLSLGLASSIANGALSSADWTTFNSKQAALSGTGFVKIVGTTISYDNSTYYLASNPNAFIALTALSGGAGISYNNTTGVITNTITQYTDALARAAISLTTTGASGASSYNNTTGVLNVPTYTLSGLGGQPLATNLTSLAALSYVSGSFVKMTAAGTFALDTSVYYLASNPSGFTSNVGTVTSVGLSSATSGVTIGATPITTSGTITLAIATSSGAQQGLLSSTDWTTFNNKQNALTSPVTGSGTTNTLSKFTGASTIGDSALSDGGAIIVATNRSLQTTGNGNYLRVGNYLMAGGSGGDYGSVGYNIGYTTTTNTYNYVFTDNASMVKFQSGGFQFLTAPSGTAGNAISFTQAMTLNASGNLSVGNTNDTYKLDVSGTGRFSGAVQINANTTGLILNRNAVTNFTGIGYLTNGVGQWFVGMRENLSSNNYIIYNESGTDAFTINKSTNAATFSSSVQAKKGLFGVSGVGTPSLNVSDNDQSNVRLRLQNTTSGNSWDLVGGLNAANNSDFSIYDVANNVTALRIVPITGAATFSSSVTATYGTLFNTSLNNQLKLGYDSSFHYTLGRTNVNGFLEFYGTQSGAIGYMFGGADGERMRITAAGNVGIGTTSPTFATGAGLAVFAPSQDARFALKNTASGDTATDGFQLVLTTALEAVLENRENGSMRFLTNATEAARFTALGYFGINKVNPGSRLAIVGLPTSSAGLTAGDVYVSAGVLMIV